AGATTGEATLLAIVGAACAGVAALVDAWLLGRFARAAAPRSFYLLAALYAAAPLPFSTIRLLLVRERPRATRYAAIVAGARLPRYLVVAHLGRRLALPAWAFALVIA